MKITKEQLEKIKQLNTAVKDLDPVLKERVIDYELYELFKDDYIKISQLIKKENVRENVALGTTEIVPRSDAEKNKRSPTLKEFFDEKKPLSATETVTVFGFYLEHYLNKSEFTEADISRAYYDAKTRKPKVIGQALRDAKNLRSFLVEGSKKGSFRVSNVGENLVIHDLPRTAQ